MRVHKKDLPPFYRQIVTDAWSLAFRHKHLWLFGFFAAMIGFGGISEVLFGVYDRTAKLLPTAAGLVDSPTLLLPGFATVRAIFLMSPYPAVSFVLFVLMAGLFFALFAFVVSLAIGGLVSGIRKIEGGGAPHFSEGIKSGTDSAFRVFVVNFGAKFIIGLMLLLTSANMVHMLTDKTMTSGFIFLASYVIFTILAVLVSIVSVFATNATIVDGLPIVPSLADGWHTLRRHWLVSIEMVIVLLFVNLAVMVLVLAATLVLSVPLIFLFMVATTAKSLTLMTTVMALTIIVLVSFIVVVVSFFTTFQSAAWTLLWLRIRKKGPIPKLMRLLCMVQEKLS